MNGRNHERSKGSEIRYFGKSEHFLPHMWHPSRFADDTTIYQSHHDINILRKLVEEELSNLISWFKANTLSLNVSKTNVIIFSKADPITSAQSSYLHPIKIRQNKAVRCISNSKYNSNAVEIYKQTKNTSIKGHPWYWIEQIYVSTCY